MQVETLEDTIKAYLKSPFLIPDLISLLGSVIYGILRRPILAKYFELIRIFHFSDTLYPMNMLIQACTHSG